jgi:hypothetical protein
MLRMIPCRAVVIRERIPFVFLRLSKLENDQSKFLVVNTNLMNAIALIFGHKPLVFFFVAAPGISGLQLMKIKCSPFPF